jgi:restriction system protein
MAIPDFQTIMLPLLRIASDGSDHTLAAATARLSDEFGLTLEERAQLLPSGRQATMSNRTAWASSYLRNAGLLESSGRGRFRVTARGRSVLDETPARIDIKLLLRFPEFSAFRRGSKSAPVDVAETSRPEATPEEAFLATYQALRRETEADLLQRVKSADPGLFEQLVVRLLVAMGYGGSQEDAGHAVGRSGDGGIDGIIKQDPLGLDAVYIQAKRWEGSVGTPIVQAFAGSLDGKHARKGVIITTSTFSSGACAYVENIEKRIILIDGATFAKLMFDHGVALTVVGRYDVKRVDLDVFDEDVAP